MNQKKYYQKPQIHSFDLSNDQYLGVTFSDVLDVKGKISDKLYNAVLEWKLRRLDFQNPEK